MLAGAYGTGCNQVRAPIGAKNWEWSTRLCRGSRHSPELTTFGSEPTLLPEVVEVAVTDMPTARLSGHAWSLTAAK